MEKVDGYWGTPFLFQLNIMDKKQQHIALDQITFTYACLHFFRLIIFQNNMEMLAVIFLNILLWYWQNSFESHTSSGGPPAVLIHTLFSCRPLFKLLPQQVIFLLQLIHPRLEHLSLVFPQNVLFNRLETVHLTSCTIWHIKFVIYVSGTESKSKASPVAPSCYITLWLMCIMCV